MVERFATSYVVLSDVHLGADLVEHVRPWSRDSWLLEQAAVDERITTLVRYYAGQDAGRVCFVLAGDFVDFMGMSMTAPRDAALRSGVTDEERAHGLGSAADHAVLKLRAVARRHESVFRAFAEVLAHGHTLVIVRGNHDLEWHWGGVQRAFVDALCEHAEDARAHGSIKRAVSFRPWFFHVPGLLYVEHGHEFDPMCSQGDPLAAVCLTDPRRMRQTTTHVLMRYVARPTRGLSTVGHERATLGRYLALATSFGLRGGARLAARFARAISRLVREVLVYRRHRERLDRTALPRLRAFARKHSLAHEAVAALRRLHVRPVTQSVRAVCRSLYLDRVATALLAMATLMFAVASVGFGDALALAFLSGIATCALVAFRAPRDIDPSHRMRSAASQIAKTLGVRYVVMGHTHEPCVQVLEDDARYVNLGFWGEDELPEDRPGTNSAPPCSYFALARGSEGYTGELLRWDPELGPQRWCGEPHALVFPPTPSNDTETLPARAVSATTAA